MPTQAIAARAGVLALSTGAAAGNANTLAELRNIRIRVNHDQIDATSNDSSGWNEYLRGSRGWTATAESLYASSSGMTYHIFADAVINDYAVSVLFQPTTAATATYCYTGTAHITDFEIGGDSKGLFVNNVNLQGTGALTYATST